MDKIYNRGLAIVPPVAVASSVGFLYAAYSLPEASSVITTIFGLSPKMQLNAAAGLVLFSIPWTYFRMLAGLDRLMAYSAAAAKGAQFDGPEAAGIRADTEDWHGTNLVRATAFASAAILGLTLL